MLTALLQLLWEQLEEMHSNVVSQLLGKTEKVKSLIPTVLKRFSYFGFSLWGQGKETTGCLGTSSPQMLSRV